MKNLKIAVVGSGAWGMNHVRVWNSLGCLAAVCDADQGRLKAIQKDFPQVKTFADFDFVLEQKDISGIVIAAPAVLHADLTLRALKAGKDVLVEKPMALTSRECQKMLAAAKKTKRILMVGHVLEYHPAVVKLKEMLQKNELGKIQYIYSHRLNFGRIRTEENALWSFAPHDIALLVRLMKSLPSSVSCSGSASLNPDIADNTVTVLNFSNGVQAHIFVSWLHPFKIQRLVIVGEKQMAVFDDTQDWEKKLLLYPHHVDWVGGKIPIARKAESQTVKLEPAEPLELECKHFLDCMMTRKQPLTDGVNGLRVIQVLEGAQKSMHKKGIPFAFKKKGENSHFKKTGSPTKTFGDDKSG